MSNEKNVYERIFKLWAMVSKMIMDGTRDPEEVTDILQAIVDEPVTTAKKYLRRLSVLNLCASDGIETFGSSGIFTGGIFGLIVPVDARAKPTFATKAIVWEMVLGGIFTQLFGSLGGERKLWTEAQIVQFCRDHRLKLCKGGYSTFFEMRGGVVARVYFAGVRLKVNVDSFWDNTIWSAEGRRRLVSLQ